MKLVFLLVTLALQSSFICGSSGASNAPSSMRREVLVLDLDGTLYEDDCLIESQIKENCWVWGKERFGLDPNACQAMHEKYGSTIRGVCEELGTPVADTVRQYYNEVYPNMDFGRLRKYSMNTGADSSGYSHGLQSGDVLRSLKKLKKLNVPIVLASNSPVFHVKRALTRLGIADLEIDAFMTPERIGGILKTDPRFWEPLFDLFPSEVFRSSLIDDNGLNIKLVSEKLGMRGLRITPQQSLAENLLRFLDVNVEEEDGKEQEPFCLDPRLYLEAKSKIDERALNREVFSRLESELTRRAASLQVKSAPLRVVDLGAGLLTMLPKVMSTLESDLKDRDTGGKGHTLDYLAFESNPALQASIREKLQGLGFASHGDRHGAAEYRFKAPKSGLVVTVFVSGADFMSSEAIGISKRLFSQVQAPRNEDDEGEDEGRPAGAPVMPPYDGVDLIMGCCVADLIEPRALAAQVLEFGGDCGGLLYLPITFAGCTEIRRPRPSPSADDAVDESLRVPSDEVVMAAYHSHLRKCGHYLDPHRLLRTLQGYGCQSLMAGGEESLPASPWVISHRESPYMFRSMMHFLALGTVLQQVDLWDIRGWFKGVHSAIGRDDKGGQGQVQFLCSNVDLLCSLPGIPQMIAAEGEAPDPEDSRVRFGDVDSEAAGLLRSTPTLHPSHQASRPSPPQPLSDSTAAAAVVPSTRQSVEFLGNRKVRVVEEAIEPLGAGQVLIKTSCSVISTGTELKVFRGDVDPDEPADLTIAGLQEESMRYPMRYGYSLVGVVVKTGEGVDPAEWLGKRVFTFSPHSSAVVASVSGLMPVPDGIADEDAAFLPSMETAVSLAMAAAPLMGERVAVVGQGLIGLLTGAVLKAANVDVTLVDVSPSRLHSAKKLIPQASLHNPTNGEKAGDFDVVVEVSGSAGGLQGAVDMAGKNGRVVLGSLYGESELSLKLGLQFHRSGIQLITSQVSAIPPALKGRWTKKRRFDLSWDFTRRIRPSRILMEGEGEHDPQLVLTFLTTDSMQETFKRLERGEIVTSLVVPKSARTFSSENQDDLSF